MKKINHVTCGCCSNGCACAPHADPDLDGCGVQKRMCEYCSKLAFAPLDRIYRFDPMHQEYVRKPQGK